MSEPVKLIQNQGFTRYEFLLSDDNLSIKHHTITEKKEWSVRLEDIGHTSILDKDTSYMKQIIYISLGLFSILFVIGNVADHSSSMKTWVWILLSMIWVWFAAVVYLSPVYNKLILGSEPNTIEFLSDKPNEQEVRDFIDEIIKRSQNVINRKYGPEPV